MASTPDPEKRRAPTFSRTFARIMQLKVFSGGFVGSYIVVVLLQLMIAGSSANQLEHAAGQLKLCRQVDENRKGNSNAGQSHYIHCSFSPSVRRGHFIHALPQEILAHIFVLGTEEHTIFPVTVSHVCGAWRELALRTPALWRRIALDRREDMWKERIRRAKSCSLDIQLMPWSSTASGSTCWQRLDVHSVQWYMHLVTPYINRWRSLEIFFAGYSPFLWNAALSGCCGVDRVVHAPFVEDIMLIYPQNDDTKYFTLFAGHAPRLRRLSLDGLRLTWLPSLFSNLTFLDYTHHGFSHGRQAVHEVLTMLHVSSRLVHLRLLFPWHGAKTKRAPPDSPPTFAPITLSALTRLHIRINGPDIPLELIHLLSYTSAPALSSLHLLDLCESSKPFSRLRSFLQACGRPLLLKTLCIEHGWCGPQLVTAFSTLPCLHQFVVKCSQQHQSQYMDLSSNNSRKEGCQGLLRHTVYDDGYVGMMGARQ
jgi:hypothetical protein